MWLALKYGKKEELAERVGEWREVLVELVEEREGLEELGTVVRYLMKVADEQGGRALRELLEWLLGEQQAEEQMTTWAGEYVKKGREQGRKEGRVEGKVEGLLQERAEALLQVLTAQGVRVSKAARERILACEDLELLRLWFARALKARRLSDVFVGSEA